MKDLIKLTQQTLNDEVVNTVNARELYEFLGIKTSFKDWVSRRIKEYRFEEGKDFCSFLSESSGGRPSKEYHISLNMAKELAMVERNEKGREARAYFIECEKKLQTHTLPQTKIEAVRAYLEELEAHEATRVALTHKKEVAKLENGKSIYGASIRQVALKTGRNYSAKKLTRWCKANCRPPLVIHPNGYSSAKVSVYHEEAWREVYDIDLLEYFEEDELQYTSSGSPYEHH